MTAAAYGPHHKVLYLLLALLRMPQTCCALAGVLLLRKQLVLGCTSTLFSSFVMDSIIVW